MQLELGRKIRELRRRDGRTQEDLASAVGVTSQAISRWEANGGYPDMEMISFGPTLQSPHSPDERCNIPSTKKFYDYLVAALAAMPVKKK